MIDTRNVWYHEIWSQGCTILYVNIWLQLENVNVVNVNGQCGNAGCFQHSLLVLFNTLKVLFSALSFIQHSQIFSFTFSGLLSYSKVCCFINSGFSPSPRVPFLYLFPELPYIIYNATISEENELIYAVVHPEVMTPTVRMLPEDVCGGVLFPSTEAQSLSRDWVRMMIVSEWTTALLIHPH